MKEINYQIYTGRNSLFDRAISVKGINSIINKIPEKSNIRVKEFGWSCTH